MCRPELTFSLLSSSNIAQSSQSSFCCPNCLERVRSVVDVACSGGASKGSVDQRLATPLRSSLPGRAPSEAEASSRHMMKSSRNSSAALRSHTCSRYLHAFLEDRLDNCSCCHSTPNVRCGNRRDRCTEWVIAALGHSARSKCGRPFFLPGVQSVGVLGAWLW